jgi:hypothetical protein
VAGLKTIHSNQLLNRKAIGSRQWQDQPGSANCLTVWAVKKQAMDRATVEVIALQIIDLPGGVFELPFDAINLVSKCKGNFDRFRGIGACGAKVRVEAPN